LNISPRSRLYSLKEAQTNSGWRESATSFLSRLAMEHCVSTQTLISEEILPALSESQEYVAQRKYSSVLFLLNGMGPFSKRWIEVLQTLTGKENLKRLTLLDWQDLIRPNDLIRKYKTWCSSCLQEWIAKDCVVFEPQLWYLKQATICPKHKILLSDKCPNPKCNKQVPVLGSSTRPGYCSYCGTWLGKTNNEKKDVSFEDDWTTNVLQEMLSKDPRSLEIATDINGRRALRFFENQGPISQASSQFLASIFGVHPATINRWKRGENPTLSILLKGCYLLQRSPFTIHNDPLDEDAVHDFIAKVVQPTEVESKLIKMYHNDQSAFLQRYRSLFISSNSVEDICRRAKVRESILVAKSPDIYNLMAKSVRKGRAAKQKSIRETLKSVILRTDEIPPTLGEVASEIGIPVRTLRKYAADICKMLARHRIDFEAKIAIRKEELMIKKVYDSTEEFLAQGIKPTALRISALLPHAAYLQNPKIRDSIKQALRDFYETRAFLVIQDPK